MTYLQIVWLTVTGIYCNACAHAQWYGYLCVC